MFQCRLLMLTLLLLIVPLTSPEESRGHDEGTGAPEILFIASYHKGDPWTDRLIEAFENRLRNYRFDLDLHYEFMDRRRLVGERYDASFYRFLRDKYNPRMFDLVVCSDDEALGFLLKHRHTLFPDVPIIFSGISDLSQAAAGGGRGVTGVAEAPDPRRTLEIALKLLPETTTVAVVNDTTAEGKVLSRIVEGARESFSGIDFVFMTNLSLTETLNRLQSLPQNTIILQLAYDRGKEETLSFARYLEVLSKSVNLPVFSLWDHTVGTGVVGGRVVTSFGQGDEVGRLAVRILEGERPEKLHVILQEASLYMFDDRQLRRFGISRRNIPDNSTIVAERSAKKPAGGGGIGGLALPGALVGLAVLGIHHLKKRSKLPCQ